MVGTSNAEYAKVADCEGTTQTHMLPETSNLRQRAKRAKSWMVVVALVLGAAVVVLLRP